MSRVLIRQPDGGWREPTLSGYAKEAELQAILAAHPELIPGISPEALTCSEFHAQVGPADIVVVDTNGTITLVECKLAANPQVRREIVGQMFDYAARLWKMDVEEFDTRWRARNNISLFTVDEDGTLLREVARNLADGRFRIALAVDTINDQLKRMVEYLNAMSGPATSIIAVEYARLTEGGVELLMPQVYGQELAEAKATSDNGDRQYWDIATYRSWLEAHDSGVVGKFDAFVQEAALNGLEFIGSRIASSPSASLQVYDVEGRRLGKVSLFHFGLQGTSVEFRFTWLAKMGEAERPDAEVIDAFFTEFASIDGLAKVAANLRSSGFQTRGPNVPLAALTEESIRAAIRATANLAGHTKGRFSEDL